MVQCCLYSCRQRYSSSQRSKFCGLTRRSRVSRQQIQHHDTSLQHTCLQLSCNMIVLFPEMDVPDWLLHCLTNRRVQRCLDSYRQRQISQSDCEITSNCGKIVYYCPLFFAFPIKFPLSLGVQGWRSSESIRLDPTNVARVQFPDSALYVGWYSGFSVSSKTNI